MLINLTVGVKDNLFLSDSTDHCDRGVALRGVARDASTILPPPPFTLESPPPPPLPPPPPPLPLNAPPPPDTCPFQRFGARRRSKLRNFNWDAIPQERVQGRRSLWSEEQCAEELQIDTGRIEELFARREESQAHRFAWRAQRTQSLVESHVHKVFLLDPKRCMNVGIFLKQFKRSVPEIVEDIRKGSGDGYCGERLAELIKHLPEKEEVKRLRAFRGDRSKLSEAELFLMLLLDVPSYTLRLEIMILKKEFPTTVVALRSSARVLKDSAQELLCCSELHMILRLVLKAGNFMNAGGYAGNAAGFHISSLLKLADTKANKPGMNLLHFVAMRRLFGPFIAQEMEESKLTFSGSRLYSQSYRPIASTCGARPLSFTVDLFPEGSQGSLRKPFFDSSSVQTEFDEEVQSRYPDLLTFPERLEHIVSGSRLSEGALLEDFYRLQRQLSSLGLTLEATEHKEIRGQMAGFLQNAQDQLEEVQRDVEALESSRQQLLEFLCEDEDTFKLEECCQIFSNFCGKFRRAVQENKERELEEQRRQQSECKRLEKRRSTATCSVMDDHISVDELAVTLERNLQAACKFGSIRRTKIRSPGINPARMSYFSCPGPWVRRDREKDLEALSDEENARQLREVSETVLNQQMGYAVSQENKARSRLRFTRDITILDQSAGPTESQCDLITAQPKGATKPSATPDLDTAVVDNHLLMGNIQEQSESSSSPPAQNISVTPVIAQQSSVGPSCTSSKTNTYTQTRSMLTKPKASSQNPAVNITVRHEINNPPLAANTPARPVGSSKPPTGYMKSRAAVNNPTSPTGSLSARPEATNGPSNGNIPADIRYQPSSRPITTQLEINKGLSTVPAKSEVINDMQTGNMTARPEVNNQPLTSSITAKPEVNNQQSNGHMSARYERLSARTEIYNQPPSEHLSARPDFSKQPSTGSKQTQPESNNQSLTKSIQAKTTVSNQPATESTSARAEVKRKLSTGNITTRPKINNQTSTGSISAISEENTEPSTRSIPANCETTNHPSVRNMSASLEINHLPPAECAPNIVPVLTRSLAYRPLPNGPTLPEFPRVGETVECRSLVKGLKSYENLTVQKAPPSPCAKWKREQLSVLEGGEGQQCSTQRTPERMRAPVCTDRSQRGKDLPKDSEPGGQRNGSARTGKRSPTEGAIRRVQSAKEKSLVTVSTQESKKPKPSSSSYEPSSSSQGVRTIPLIRRTTLPRMVQSKARVTTPTEELKDPSLVTRKETQESGIGKVRDLDKDKGQSFTIRPALASPRKPLTRTDAIRYPRDTGTSPVAHRGATSPRPGSVSPSLGATTPPVSPRGQTPFRLKPAEAQHGRGASPVSPSFLTPPKNPLNSPKKTRVVAPPVAKVVKHCSPVSTADPSQAERSRRTGSQPTWR